MSTAETLMQLQDALFYRYKLESAPAGEMLQEITRELSGAILEAPGLLEAITPADLDALTMHNYHTARRAAEKALQIS